MKTLRIALVALLLASLTIQADPVLTHFFDPPTEYINNTPIVGDTLSYTYWCGANQGGPYPIPVTATPPNLGPPTTDDMGPCHSGTPGTYYYVLRATSTLHNAEGPDSNELNFTVTSGQLGFVPKAVTNLQVVNP